MEFFAYVKQNVSSENIQKRITIENMSKYCDSIDAVLEHKDNRGAIYCLWGEFKVRRECIDKGVRFSLPKCPNCMAWTITTETGDKSPQILIHLTTNCEQHDAEFVNSIKDFLAGWEQGVSQLECNKVIS